MVYKEELERVRAKLSLSKNKETQRLAVGEAQGGVYQAPRGDRGCAIDDPSTVAAAALLDLREDC